MNEQVGKGNEQHADDHQHDGKGIALAGKLSEYGLVPHVGNLLDVNAILLDRFKPNGQTVVEQHAPALAGGGLPFVKAARFQRKPALHQIDDDAAVTDDERRPPLHFKQLIAA